MRLKHKIIWIAISVAVFAGVWTGVFIQDRVATQARGNSLLKRLESEYPLSLPESVTCKRMINDGFVSYDGYAYYEINDSDFVWKNSKGDEIESYETFVQAFNSHFGFLMKGCEPDMSKAYEYSYYAKGQQWVYILYIPEDNALAVGICAD